MNMNNDDFLADVKELKHLLRNGGDGISPAYACAYMAAHGKLPETREVFTAAFQSGNFKLSEVFGELKDPGKYSWGSPATLAFLSCGEVVEPAVEACANYLNICQIQGWPDHNDAALTLWLMGALDCLGIPLIRNFRIAATQCNDADRAVLEGVAEQIVNGAPYPNGIPSLVELWGQEVVDSLVAGYEKDESRGLSLVNAAKDLLNPKT